MNAVHDPSFEMDHLPDVEPRELIRALFARVHDIVVVCDRDGVVRFVNDAITEHLGFTTDAVIGRRVDTFVAEADAPRITASIARWGHRKGQPRGNEVDVRTVDGSVRRFHYRAHMGTDLYGSGGFIVTVSPASEADDRADLIPALIENTNRVARIAAVFLDEPAENFGAALGVAVRELAGLEWLNRITIWTIRGPEMVLSAQWDAAYQAPSRPPPERLRIDPSQMLRSLVGGNEVRLLTAHDDASEFVAEARAFAAAGTTSLLGVPLTARGAVLGAILLESTIDAVIDGASHMATVRAATAVIAAAMLRNRAELELAHQARTDRTTGLLNRWAAQGDLSEMLVRLANRGSRGVGVIGIDLDRFKLVNEALGHRAGDRLLGEVSERLRSAAPPGAWLARLSADEFLVVIPDVESETTTRGTAERILEPFTIPFDIDGSTVSVTARAGVVQASAVDDHLSAEELLRRVANTVDQAKRSGRLVETFDVTEDGQLRRLRRVSQLERALLERELVPYFQAEWDLKTNRVIGAETLLRWVHPTEGLIGADSVIPLAESSGLIDRIGQHILAEACRIALSWLDLVDDFLLRVNVSAHQLRSEDFTDRVAEILTETGFPPTSLCLELTESTLLDDPARSRQHFAHLRQLGVGLAIDDFGTGYSSILQLKQLPLSSLKIDQRFVAGVASSASDRAIVEATLELARAFGVTTTAEGVEEEHQREILEKLGCVRMQGFLFSRPEPAEQLTARLLM